MSYPVYWASRGNDAPKKVVGSNRAAKSTWSTYPKSSGSDPNLRNPMILCGLHAEIAIVIILPSSHFLGGGDVNHETVQVVLHKAWEVLSAGRPGDTWQPFRCTKRGATPSKNDGGYHGNILDYTQQSDGWVWTWLVSIPNENINSSTILAINHWKKGGTLCSDKPVIYNQKKYPRGGKALLDNHESLGDITSKRSLVVSHIGSISKVI